MRSFIDQLSIILSDVSIVLFCYDFPMTAFHRPDMLDALCFLHIIQLLLDAIRCDADDLGKLFASSERVLANFIKNHFLGTTIVFCGGFLGNSRIFFLVVFSFCIHNHVSAFS